MSGPGFSIFGTPINRGGDSVAPTCVLTTSAPTYVYAAISVTATFSEVVTGFDAAGDVAVTNGSAGDPVDAGDGIVYTIAITPTGAGTLSVQVGAGVCTDEAGNPNTASNEITRMVLPDFGNSISYADFRQTSGAAYQEAARTTPATDTDDPIGSITDFTGGQHWSQTAVSGPDRRLILSTLNDVPCALGNGVDQFIAQAAGDDNNQPVTIYWRGAIITLNSGYIYDGVDSGKRMALAQLSSARLTAYAGTGFNSSNNAANTNEHVYCFVVNGASSVVYEDNVSLFTGDAGSHVINGFTLFATYAGATLFNGKMIAFAAFVGAHDEPTRTLVHTFLA